MSASAASALANATFSIGIRGPPLFEKVVPKVKTQRVVCSSFRKPTYTFTLTQSFFTVYPYPADISPAVRNALILVKRAADSEKLIQYYTESSKVSPFGKQIKFPMPLQGQSLWSPSFAKELSQNIHRVRRHKAALHGFLQRWRSKRLRIRNTDDVVTLGPIKTLVSIVDWAGRQSYQFEASSLMHDITARLLNHDGFFDSAQVPRNALTNEPLTLAQQISVWIQITRCASKQTWPFAALRTCRWNIRRFQEEYGIPLRLHSLRRTMSDMNHVDTRESLLDFIQIVHGWTGTVFQEKRYDSMMKIYVKGKASRLHDLHVLCIQYNEAGILYAMNLPRLAIEEQLILQKAARCIYT